MRTIKNSGTCAGAEVTVAVSEAGVKGDDADFAPYQVSRTRSAGRQGITAR